MRTFFAALSAACFLIFASTSQAQTLELQITWDIPTTRVDGSPLPASEYGGTIVRWGECALGTFPNQADVVGATGMETVNDSSLAFDTLYCFEFVGYDINGLQAAPIPAQSMSLPAPIANPSPVANVQFVWSII